MPSRPALRSTAVALRSCNGGSGRWGCGTRMSVTALMALVVTATPGARAESSEPTDAYGPRIEVESLPYAMQPRSAVNGTRARFDTPNDGLRTRLWWGKGGLEVGAGANLNPSHTAPGLAATPRVGTAVVGLRARVAQGTHLAIERDTLGGSVGAGGAAAVESSRVALEFKAVGHSKAAQPLSSGLLRVQMSGTSSLQFKPRSGGLAVTYRAKF